MSGLSIRPMVDGDVARTAAVTAAAFQLDFTAQATRERSYRQARHALATDPGGCFVAERSGEVIGVAQAIVRDGVWILALLTVDPAAHSSGAGRALLDATLQYHAELEPGLIVASNDPRALRLYASAGFRLQATFEALGKLDPTLIPAPDPQIVAVAPDEVQALAPISRAVRGAQHTLEFPLVFSRGGTVFRLHDRGFVIALPGRGIWGPAALDAEAATALLWRALDHLKHDQEVRISVITDRQQWAIDVLLAAGLPFKAEGALAVRGDPGPLYPYIPTTAFA